MKYVKRYTNFLKSHLAPQMEIGIVLDGSDGSVGMVLKDLFRGSKDVRVKIINHKPRGSFPTHGPDPSADGALDQVSRLVIKRKANFGAVFDSDGDRVIFVDNLGREIEAYQIFQLIKRGLKPPYILDSRALINFWNKESGIIESKSGRHFIAKAMKENDATLGVEGSGHYFFKEFFFKDSAILTLVHLINLASSTGSPLSEEIDSLDSPHRTKEFNYKIDREKDPIGKVKEHFRNKQAKIDEIDGISVYTEDFAFNLRESATEPLIRLNIVAKNDMVADNLRIEIEAIING